MQLWEITDTNDTGNILSPKTIWSEDPPVAEFTINCKKVGNMKRLEDIETEECSLEVYECNCGFHIGLDATFLEQVEKIRINCPSCDDMIDTSNTFLGDIMATEKRP